MLTLSQGMRSGSSLLQVAAPLMRASAENIDVLIGCGGKSALVCLFSTENFTLRAAGGKFVAHWMYR